MKAKGFKVGDKAIVIHNASKHGFEIGEHVRIKLIGDKGLVDMAEHLDGSDWWCITDSELKKWRN